MKVLGMWRQEDTPAGQQQLRLVRAGLGESVEFKSIVIRDGKSTSPGSQNHSGTSSEFGGKIRPERLQEHANPPGPGDCNAFLVYGSSLGIP